MDLLLNMQAFLATVRTGSFSEASRQLGVAPSVVTKRVSQLEDHIHARLLNRTTRKVSLSETGRRSLPNIVALIDNLNRVLAEITQVSADLEGHLRIKAPTTLAELYIGGMLARFQQAHPRISLDLVVLDRSVNPIEEGFDISIGALPVSYGGVIDVPLCPYPRILCAAPAYLAARGMPEHPGDLVNHDCLAFIPGGLSWTFESDRGTVVIDIRPKFSTNATQVLLAAARAGSGITVLAEFAALPALHARELVPVLPGYQVPEIWIKAMIPQNRIALPVTQTVLSWLQAELAAGLPGWHGEKPPAG